MGDFNCLECCESCIEILVGDLPAVAITGWTGAGWTGGPCCWCQSFTPNSLSAWTEVCTAEFGEAKIQVDCTWDERAITKAKPKKSIGPTCPIPSDWCCDGPVVTIGSGTSNTTYTAKWKLLVAYRPVRIDICISKQETDCAGVLVTQYVITSKYCYEAKAIATLGTVFHQDKVTTISDSCFEYHGLGTPCNYSPADVVRTAACTLAASSVPDTLLFDGEVCFDRVKFYAVLPTGDVTWTNADNGGGCTWELCDNAMDYATEYCFTVSGWPAGLKPCWCDYDWTVGTTTTTTDIVSTCGCDTCIMGACGTRYSNYDLADCGIVGISCCAGGCNCGDVCYSYNTTCFTATWGGPVECPEPYDPAVCFLCWSHCDCNITCLKLKASTGDTDPCYWHLICDTDVGLAPKYSVIPTTGKTAVFDTTCTFLGAVSVCIAAPTWTTVFS